MPGRRCVAPLHPFTGMRGPAVLAGSRILLTMPAYGGEGVSGRSAQLAEVLQSAWTGDNTVLSPHPT